MPRGELDLTELVLERSYHVATLDYDLELIEEHVTAFVDRVTQAGTGQENDRRVVLCAKLRRGTGLRCSVGPSLRGTQIAP